MTSFVKHYFAVDLYRVLFSLFNMTLLKLSVANVLGKNCKKFFVSLVPLSGSCLDFKGLGKLPPRNTTSTAKIVETKREQLVPNKCL